MDFRVERCLQLFADLKQKAAAFAKREEVLTKELGSRRYAVNKTAQDAMAAKDATHQTHLTQGQAYYDAEAQRIRKIYDARQSRVNQYSTTRLKDLPRLAQELKSKWKGDLQMLNRRAERKKAEAIAEADAD